MSSSPRATQLGMALAIGMAVGLPVVGSSSELPYAQMAPLARYLTADRSAEVDLARSAAPRAISLHATVLVLTARGYETVGAGHQWLHVPGRTLVD